MPDFEEITRWLIKDPSAAGWIQAGGAILALAATVLAAWIPVFAGRRNRRDAQNRLLLAAYRGVSASAWELGQTVDWLIRPENREFIAQHGANLFVLEHALDTLNKLPRVEIWDDEVVQVIETTMKVLRGILTQRDSIREQATAGGIDPSLVLLLEGFRDRVVSESRRLAKNLRRRGLRTKR